MKRRNTAVLLASLMLAGAFTACGGGDGEPSASQAQGTEKAQATEQTQAATQEENADAGKMHIAVETVEISLSDLKAQNYTVPVRVDLVKNAGITYSEWGLKLDERCTFAVQKKPDEPLALTVYHAENPEQHFIWTAWASGTQVIDETGAILFVDVTLPEDAKAGDHYTVEYADWSLADKGHVWSNDSDEWAASGDVTWTDGGVTVTE